MAAAITRNAIRGTLHPTGARNRNPRADTISRRVPGSARRDSRRSDVRRHARPPRVRVRGRRDDRIRSSYPAVRPCQRSVGHLGATAGRAGARTGRGRRVLPDWSHAIPPAALRTNPVGHVAGVLEHTCKAAEALGMTVEKISQWYDVDSLSDLRRLRRGIARRGRYRTLHTHLAGGRSLRRTCSCGWCENDQEELTWHKGAARYPSHE